MSERPASFTIHVFRLIEQLFTKDHNFARWEEVFEVAIGWFDRPCSPWFKEDPSQGAVGSSVVKRTYRRALLRAASYVSCSDTALSGAGKVPLWLKHAEIFKLAHTAIHLSL